MSAPRTKFTPCKSCHEMVECDLPEPEKIVVKEKCQCGLTELARMTRYWSTAAALVLIALSLSVYGGCYASSQTAIEATKAQVSEYKLKNEQLTQVLTEIRQERAGYVTEANRVRVELGTEITRLRAEIEKYRYVMGELKLQATPALAEEFVQPGNGKKP